MLKTDQDKRQNTHTDTPQTHTDTHRDTQTQTDRQSDFVKNKSQSIIRYYFTQNTLRSDADLHLIWPNSSHRVLDCIIVIQITSFA